MKFNNSYLIVINGMLVGWFSSRSCGVARSIIVGFHPADPGSNPGTSILTKNRLGVASLEIFFQPSIHPLPVRQVCHFDSQSPLDEFLHGCS